MKMDLFGPNNGKRIVELVWGGIMSVHIIMISSMMAAVLT